MTLMDLHIRRLIDAPAFPSVFTLYFVLVWGVLNCICLLVFKPNQYEGNKRRKIFIYMFYNQATINLAFYSSEASKV